MTTTTIRIEDKLKARVAAAAEREGKTSHAFILDAIAQSVEHVELDADFHRVADARWAKVLATGKTVPWDEAKAYLEARARRAPAQATGSQTWPLTQPMARLELAPELFDDFDRCFDHLAKIGSGDAPKRIAEIVQALQLLTHSPLIGRKVTGGKRELVIGRDSHGCVALYRFVTDIDTVFVLAVRSQRESGYKPAR